MNSYFLCNRQVTILTGFTASYSNQCHPLLHFVDVYLISQDLDIVQLLSDIQWDFTMCFNG